MSTKDELQKVIDNIKFKRLNDANGVIKTIQEQFVKAVEPVLTDMVKEIGTTVGDAIKAALKDIKIDAPEMPSFPEIPAPQVTVNVPDVKVPNIRIPTITIPKADAPVVNIPPVNFPSEMSLKPNTKPFPVLMVDQAGKAMQFPVGGGGGSGRGDFFTIKDIQSSTGGSLISDPESALRVTGSVAIGGATGTIAASIVDSIGIAFEGSNPFPVTFASPIGQGDTASAIRVIHAGDGIASVAITGINSPVAQGDAAAALRVILAGNSDASVVVNSGTITTVTTLTGVTNSIQVVALDRDGNPLTTGPIGQGDTATALRIVHAGDSAASIATQAQGLNETNSGVLRVVHMTDTVQSNNVVAFNGNAPATGLNETNTGVLRTVLMSDTVYSTAITGINGPVAQGDAASALRVILAGNSDASVVVNSGTLTTVTTLTGITNTVNVRLDSPDGPYTAANPLPTTATISLPAGPGDGATATRFIQAGDSVSSINVLQINGNAPATGLNETTAGVLRVTIMTDTAQSANVTAFNGNAPATGLNETTSGVLRTVLMSDTVSSVNISTFNGNAPATGLNETTSGVLRVVQMSDTANSVVVNSGTLTTVTTVTSLSQFNGNTPAQGLNETTAGVLRTVTMSDTASSTQAKLIAMTTLPTAAADAATVFQKSDKLGRAISRPTNVRDLISTAYVTLSTGTEATLLAGVAGNFLDLISIIATNTSTAAQQVDIRCVTAGNIVQSLYIPANATTGWTPPVPWPQDATGNNWTVDMADVTNSNILISALFSKES